MIRFHTSADRCFVRDGALEMWRSFDPAIPEPSLRQGFRALRSLDEVKAAHRTEFKIFLDQNREVLSYVREGGLLIRRGTQQSRRPEPCAYQRAGAHSWINAELPEYPSLRQTEVFLSSMGIPPGALETEDDFRQFTVADRHGRLLQIAAPMMGVGASLPLQQDVLPLQQDVLPLQQDVLPLQQDVRLYTSVLDAGQHLVHELEAGRGAWLQVISGRIRLLDQDLESGDGASLEIVPAVSFTAQEHAEILLLDLA